MLTFKELSHKFLLWCAAHQSERTHEWYGNYLDMFCAYPRIADTSAYELKPYQVQEWIDSHGDKWGNTYRGGAVVAVKRVYHWAEEMGYGDGNPVKKLKKPPADRRKTYAKPDGVDAFLQAIDDSDPFRDMLVFSWACGCRPQEARHIEARHVNIERQVIIFPAKESKGKRHERKILINKTTLPIIEKLLAKYPEGKLFRNTRGEAWTKFALCNRMGRLSERTGVKITAYDLRHGYITKKIKDGVNHMVIAPAVGHTDGSMIGKVYSHVSEEEQHLREALGD
jgi:integrase